MSDVWFTVALIAASISSMLAVIFLWILAVAQLNDISIISPSHKGSDWLSCLCNPKNNYSQQGFELLNKIWDVGAYLEVWNKTSKILLQINIVVRGVYKVFLSGSTQAHTHTHVNIPYVGIILSTAHTGQGSVLTKMDVQMTLLLFYALGILCTVWSDVHVVVTDSAGVWGLHRGGRRDLGHRGLQVWECSQQGRAEEAEFKGWCRRTPGRHMTDGYLRGFITQGLEVKRLAEVTMADREPTNSMIYNDGRKANNWHV